MSSKWYKQSTGSTATSSAGRRQRSETMQAESLQQERENKTQRKEGEEEEADDEQEEELRTLNTKELTSAMQGLTKMSLQTHQMAKASGMGDLDITVMTLEDDETVMEIEAAYQKFRKEKEEWKEHKRGDPPMELAWKGKGYFDAVLLKVKAMVQQLKEKTDPTSTSKNQDMLNFISFHNEIVEGEQLDLLLAVKSLRTKITYSGRKTVGKKRGETRINMALLNRTWIKKNPDEQHCLMETIPVVVKTLKILGYDVRLGPVIGQTPLEAANQGNLSKMQKKSRRRRGGAARKGGNEEEEK
jgi:hypothetical protein